MTNAPTLSPLETIIRHQIAEHGAISVHDYMELALAHPEHGYYMTRNPFGRQGDFTTAPEICQIFGELLGTWCAAMWQLMGEREMVLLECGPGRGTLMSDMLRATRHVQGFHDSLVIIMLESSASLTRFQRATLEGMHPRIHWQPTLEELPDMPILCVANEFFDALPIRQYVNSSHGMMERMVSVDDKDALCFVTQPTSLQLVKGGATPDENSDSDIRESCPPARQIATALGHHIAEYGGAALIVDYGYDGDSSGNTLQAVREHGFWPVLKDPGTADITAHVSFDDLAESFSEQGLDALGFSTQGHFLDAIGGTLRLEYLLRDATQEQGGELYSGYHRLVDTEQMGDLFKVLAVCSDEDIAMPGFGDEAHDVNSESSDDGDA